MADTSTQPTLSDKEASEIRQRIGQLALWCHLPAMLAPRFAQRRREEFVELIRIGVKLVLGVMGVIIAALWVLFHSVLVGHDAQLWWWLVGSEASLIVLLVGAVKLQICQQHYVGLVAVFSGCIITNMLACGMLVENAFLAQEANYLGMLLATVLILAVRLPLHVSIPTAIIALLVASLVAIGLGAHPVWSLLLTSYLATVLITFFIGLIMERQDRINFLQEILLGHEASERMRLNVMLERLATEDQLTGLANRRRFDTVLHHEWGRCQRGGQPLALLFIDVDFFKHYNDHYGHGMGDECLTAVGQAIKSSLLRPADLAARYGGEEFVVILPETDQTGAEDVANRIANHIRALAIPHEASDAADHVTVSIGLAVQVPTKHASSQMLLEAADQGVYAAKDAGRNCIRVNRLGGEVR